MSTVVSRDGTQIAFDRSGEGPPLIIVDGALCYREFGPSGPLAALLSPHFTVYTYDRRGRGESSDTAPYAVEREVEDFQAIVNEAGGSAYVYGVSSGAALALDAAAHGVDIKKLAVYEAPFIVDDTRTPFPVNIVAQLAQPVAAGRPGDAVKIFMKMVGVPAFFIAIMRFMPAWSKLKAVAHTLPYDLSIVGDSGSGKPLPSNRWMTATVPTLVMDGGKSPAWMRNAMQALGEVLPNAQHRTLEGQTHILKPKVMAPVLMEFFERRPADVSA
jgi:pimeloyl-ACP methyl ester carboxylesterase